MYSICVAVIAVLAFIPSAAQQILSFERLTSRQGLSQVSVQCITQDSRGFMWFGTQDGLNRWDGHTMKVYRFNPRKAGSLSSNDIRAIHEDHDGTLWVGTQSGLNAFNYATEEFTVFKNDPKDPSSLSMNYVMAITEDREGTLWVGTYGGGLNKFIRSAGEGIKGRFQAYRANRRDPSALSHDIIMRLAADKVTGELWVACYGGGLHRYQRDRNVFVPYFSDSTARQAMANNLPIRNNTIEAMSQVRSSQFWLGRDGAETSVERFDYLPMSKTARFTSVSKLLTNGSTTATAAVSLPTNIIRSIHEDRAGRLWIGTESNGLMMIDMATGKRSLYESSVADFTSIGDNTILSIYEDRMGTLWFGTENGGVSYVNPQARKFVTYSNDSENERSLSDNSVWAIYEDRLGTTWVGTGYGLNRLDTAPLSGESKFTRYMSNDEDPNALSANEVTAICEAPTGTLWVGTNGGGLNRYERSPVTGLGGFRVFKPDPDRPRSLSNPFVQALLPDRTGKLWVGTATGLNRLDGFDASGEAEFTRFGEKQGLSNRVITCLYEDRQGTLWVGTIDGLNRYERSTNSFTNFGGGSGSVPDNLSNNYIMSICEDAAGYLWIGTQGGLNRFDRATGQFKVVTEKDGLPNDFIYGILEDRKGNLWLSTNKGLCRYNPATGSFRVYDERDGLQGDEFQNGSFFRGRSGLMYFGGANGFNVFHPDSIRDNTIVPKVVFTNFVRYNPRTGLERRIDAVNEQREVIIPFGEKITIGFAVSSFVFTYKNRYRYKLEEYDQHWIESGVNNSAQYTNLDPGEYTFRVQGSNYDGVWNTEGAALTIIVRPPWWKTWWFTVLAIVGIVVGIWLIYRWRVRAIEDQNHQLEKLVADRTKELEESNLELSHANEEVQRQIELLDQQSREIELANTELGERNQQLEVTNERLEFAFREVKSAQAQLIQSEKMASLGQLLAGVAHEINNPVNFVAGAVKPLRRNVTATMTMFKRYAGIEPETVTPENAETVRTTLADIRQESEDIELPTMIEQTNDLFDSIAEGAQRIGEIVKTLGNFSRADTSEIKRVNVHEGIDSTLKLLYNQYKSRVSVVKDYGELSEIDCYPGQLNQVFMNILVNAIHAIPKERTDGEIRISTARDGDNVVLRIRDNGSGMSDETKKRIFDPFFTTKEVGSGTGLGLSISFSIIEKHRGSIAVESTLGKGSEFVITLPIHQAA